MMALAFTATERRDLLHRLVLKRRGLDLSAHDVRVLIDALEYLTTAVAPPTRFLCDEPRVVVVTHG